MVMYGQIIIGPPGSGKSTFCNGMKQFFDASNRKIALVNLDPANDLVPYEVSIDIRSVVQLEKVMEEHELGPNGALVYCMKQLETNIDWLIEQLRSIPDVCFAFDFPGQVELYTNETCVLNILKELQQQLDMRMTVVHLVDAHYCTDSYKFISVLLLSLSSMVRLELPHVNILSKIDLIEQYGSLPFALEYYTDVLDLSYLLQHLNSSEKSKKFEKLNAALVDLIQDFSLVRFLPLNIQDVSTMLPVVKMIDKCNGSAYAQEFDLLNVAATPVGESEIQQSVADVQEKYL